MMKNPRRRRFGCAIVLICLSAYSGISEAASPNAPTGKIAQETKSKVENALRVIGKKITRKAPVDTKSALALLTVHLSENPYIYGAAFAFAPVKKTNKLIKSSPYVYRRGKKLIEKDLIEAYDYTVQDWYALPAKTQKPVWSEPYYDEGGGNAWMITYSIPIYAEGKRHQLIGVLTSDLLVPSE